MAATIQDTIIGSIRDEFSPCEEEVEGIPLLRASFWTAAQRKGHPLHEISYRACFKPELPRFLISRLSEPGGTVLDPFMGRGTTVLETGLMGRLPIGNDINPLSTLLVMPRVRSLDPSAVSAWLQQANLGKASTTDLAEARALGLDAFYHEGTLVQVCALRRLLMEADVGESGQCRAADWVRMVALNRLTGHSSGFFSGRTMPPNQAVSAAAQQRINARLGAQPPLRDVKAIVLSKTRSLLRGGLPAEHAAHLCTGPAWSLPGVEPESVDLVVTSPPFLDVVQYADDNWLRCWFAGIDAAAIPMGIHKTLSAWEAMMSDVLLEMHRVLKPGGHVAVEVGEVRKGEVRLEESVIRASKASGLRSVCVLINEQTFTKTASLWGVGNMTGGTNTNRIVVMRKD